MPIHPSGHYEELLQSYRAEPDKVVFFVGAGLSRPLFPSWRDFLEALLDRCVAAGALAYDAKDLKLRLAEGRQYLDVAELLVESLDGGAVRDVMRRLFDKKFEKADVPAPYRNLLALRPSLLITTNYDRIPEVAGHGQPTFTNLQSREVNEAIANGDAAVFQFHGGIKTNDSLVVTRRQYDAIANDSPALQQVLKTVFSQRTVVFLGYSLNDPDLDLLMSRLKWDLGGFGRPHYALMPHMTAFDARVLERRLGVRVIGYKPSAPHHPEVDAFITSLKAPPKTKTKATAKAGAAAAGAFVPGPAHALPPDELDRRLRRYEAFDPRGIIKVTDTSGDRIADYKACLTEARGACFISGTSMLHLADDSRDLLIGKLEDGCPIRLLIMDPAWIKQHRELLTFLRPPLRATFHREIESAIEKLLDIRKRLSASAKKRMSIRKYGTVFPHIVTAYRDGGEGKMVVEVTDYLPEATRPRFTLHPTDDGKSLFSYVEAKFETLWKSSLTSAV